SDISRPSPHTTLLPYTTLFRSVTTLSLSLQASRSDPCLPNSMAKCSSPTSCHPPATSSTSTPRAAWPVLAKANLPLNSSPWKARSEEHTSELQSRENLVCRLLL